VGIKKPSHAERKLEKFTRFPKRARAHCNPLADETYEHPVSPDMVNWKEMYPNWDNENDEVTILDVGCAYGGLICSIAPIKPKNYILGIEIRKRVVDFTQERITKLRNKDYSIDTYTVTGKANKEEIQQLTKPDVNHDYRNVWAIRSNAMKYLPCYFEKEQLEKIFFMFPDPHFKKKNHRRRIISPTLIAEYAYLLKKGGMIYTITDVKELGDWMQKHLHESTLFERVSEEELRNDPLIPFIYNASEDGQRTSDQNKPKYMAVFRKK
jgi:tRNA (guanine-N7-)-methyltransferase